GMKAEAVENGRQALIQLAEGDVDNLFDVVILDLQMPEMNGFELATSIRRGDNALPTRSTLLPMVLLTSAALKGEAEAAEAAGITAYLHKPVRQDALRRAIYDAITQGHRNTPQDGFHDTLYDLEASPSHDTAEEEPTTFVSSDSVANKSTSPDLPTTSELPLRVLLAENNPVNRRLLVRLLEKRGVAVTVVPESVSVLDAIVSGAGYDLLLIDCQFPGDDALVAVQTLRARESNDTRTVRLPVIALTNDATESDHHAALSAGMDAILRKPIRADDLLTTVERWTRRRLTL
ncbi:MAG: response regulator, partial [Fibrella sp.]|nr:response regulator [Armatimonadota bacterium]